jgi:hypothetical protein
MEYAEKKTTSPLLDTLLWRKLFKGAEFEIIGWMKAP